MSDFDALALVVCHALARGYLSPAALTAACHAHRRLGEWRQGLAWAEARGLVVWHTAAHAWGLTSAGRALVASSPLPDLPTRRLPRRYRVLS